MYDFFQKKLNFFEIFPQIENLWFFRRNRTSWFFFFTKIENFRNFSSKSKNFDAFLFGPCPTIWNSDFCRQTSSLWYRLCPRITCKGACRVFFPKTKQIPGLQWSWDLFLCADHMYLHLVERIYSGSGNYLHDQCFSWLFFSTTRKALGSKGEG